MTTTAGQPPVDLVALVHRLRERGLTLASAESLTAGRVAASVADVPGASAVLQGGVVAYQNRVKQDLLGVSATLLDTRGAVAPETARQMAAGVRRVVGADIGIATTGVAGPEPHQGQAVGTVWLGLAVGEELAEEAAVVVGERGDYREPGSGQAEASSGGTLTLARLLRLDGDREAVRAASTQAALALVAELLGR